MAGDRLFGNEKSLDQTALDIISQLSSQVKWQNERDQCKRSSKMKNPESVRAADETIGKSSKLKQNKNTQSLPDLQLSAVQNEAGSEDKDTSRKDRQDFQSRKANNPVVQVRRGKVAND